MDSARTRAADSSMPSGMPSSVRHSRATEAAFSSVSVKPGRAPSRARREQPDGFVPGQFVRGRVIGRQVQRLHPPDGLASDPERLTAGRHDPQPWAPGQQQLDERGAVADLMLAGVQDEQHVPGTQRLGQRLRERHARLLAHPDGRGDALGGLAAPVGQIHQPGLIEVGRLGAPGLRPVCDPAAPVITSRASRTASRVLPMPPGPLRVSARTSVSSLASSARSRSRPMKLFGSAGRLPASRAVAECMGPLEFAR